MPHTAGRDVVVVVVIVVDVAPAVAAVGLTKRSVSVRDRLTAAGLCLCLNVRPGLVMFQDLRGQTPPLVSPPVHCRCAAVLCSRVAPTERWQKVRLPTCHGDDGKRTSRDCAGFIITAARD